MTHRTRLSLVCAAVAYVVLALGCKKPLAVCPEPPPLYWPVLRTQSLTLQSTDAAVARAYAVDLHTLKGRLAEALTLLNGYRTKTPPTKTP